MGHSCCGNHNHNKDHGKHCCGHSKHAARSGSALLWGTVLAVFLAVGAITAYSLAEPPSTAPAKPVPPAQPAAPAQPASPEKTAPAAPEPETAKGVIRHGRAEPIAKPDVKVGRVIRIATYNIENFLDHEIPSDGSGPGTPIKPAAHRKALADAIHKVNADIIALEEVESKETITKFRDEYLADMGYANIGSIDAGDPRGIEQSILSRFPIKEELNWPRVTLDAVHAPLLGRKPNPEAGKPIILHRSPMRATIAIPGADSTAAPDAPTASGEAHKPLEITLFAVHHKSGAYYGFEREAEAKKTLALVQEFEKAHPGAPVLVLGDFNSRTTESCFATYTKGGMIDAFSGVPGGVESKEFLSHVSGRTIDHILVNTTAAAMVDPDTRFVLGTLQRPEGVDWRRTEPPAGYASDHYPIVIDLLTRENPGIHRGLAPTAPDSK